MKACSLITANKFIMWNLCSSSKLISDREKKRNYELHMQKLQKMKPKMKIVAPPQPDFVYTKNKLQMSRRDRLMLIDYQNEILLAKMQKINKEQYTTNRLRPEAQQLKTLNQHVMNQQAEEIYNQNRRICQKLMKVNSYYPTLDIVEKTEQLERVRFNISENARRAQSAAHLRPLSSLTYHSSRFQRSRTYRNEQEGNQRQEQPLKSYQAVSQADLRPESAPTSKSRRPYSSETFRKSQRRGVQRDNAEEGGN